MNTDNGNSISSKRKSLIIDMKSIFGKMILAAEAVAAIYAICMSYILTSWMESDSFAAIATDHDWWIEGGKRLMIVSLGALAVASIAGVVNKHLFRQLGLPQQWLDVYSAACIFTLMVAAGVIGSIEFVLTRPFM